MRRSVAAGPEDFVEERRTVPLVLPFAALAFAALWLDGLPMGVQLVARHGREDLLVRVAAQLEQALPWADRHPPVNAVD